MSSTYSSLSISQKVMAVCVLLLITSSVLGGPLGIISRGERQLFLLGCVVSGLWALGSFRQLHLRHIINSQPLMLAPLVFFFLNLLWLLPLAAYSVDALVMGLTEFQSLALLPVTVLVFQVLQKKSDWLFFAGRLAVLLCAFLAVSQSAIWMYLKLYMVNPEQIYHYVDLIFGTRESVFILEQPSNHGSYIRVVWISSYWLVFAVFMTPLFIKNHILVFLMQAAFGLAIVASYTRGIWLGLLIGMLVFILAMHWLAKRSFFAPEFLRWRWSLLGVGVAVALVFMADYMRGNSYAMLSRFYIDDPKTSLVVSDESVAERRLQTILLLEKWRERPLLGHGYGAYVETHFSHPERPFLYEMVPVALLMKLGIVGFGIYLLSLLFLVLRMGKLAMRSESGVALLAATVAYLIQVHTNPVFFSFTGMLIFSLLIYFWLALETNGGHTLSNTHASTAI